MRRGTFRANRWGRGCAAVAAGAGLLAAPPTMAQDEDYSSVDVAELIRELRETQAEVRDLKEEVHELRAKTGDNWMTEERAREVRAIVADVLADADHRASLLQGGATAGWTPDDGFFLASPQGDFLLNIDGMLQTRFIYNWKDEPDANRYGFEVTRAKLGFSGHVVNRDLTYLLRINVTRNEPRLITGIYFLEDAWMRYQFTDRWALRFGQYKVPFTREELVSSAEQLTVERSIINEHTNLGRTQGAELNYADRNLQWRLSIDDGVVDNAGFGFSGASPVNSAALAEDVEWSFTSRLEWKAAGTWEQFQDFTSRMDEPFGILVGAAVHWQEGEHGVPAFIVTEQEWWGYTLDLSVEFGGANLFASWTYHRFEDPGITQTGQPGFDNELYGIVLQGGFYITPKIEVFGRYEWGQAQTSIEVDENPGPPVWETGIAFDTLHVATVGFNYYLDDHRLKWTTDFGFTFGETDSPFATDIAGYRTDSSNTQLVFRTQFQLLF